MAKTLLYKLFGIGRMPTDLRAAAEGEGVILFEEGIRGTVTYRDFRGGGRYANWKRQWYGASIALTARRLIGCRHSQLIIDVALDDPRIKQMTFATKGPDVFAASFEAGLFQKDWSGKLEYQFKTPIAQTLQDELQKRVR